MTLESDSENLNALHLQRKLTGPQIWDFWMRLGGSEKRLFRTARKQELPVADRLFAALVRSDKAEAEKLLASMDNDAALSFLGLTRQFGLASFAWLSISRLGLKDQSAKILVHAPNAVPTHQKAVATAEDGIFFGDSLSSNLLRQSALEQDEHGRLEKLASAVATALNQHNVAAAWVKGHTLSRTVYEDFSLRFSSDIDLVVAQEKATELLVALKSLGYAPILNDPGFCHQLGVGPTASFADLFAAPSDQFAPSTVVGFHREHWPIIDVKFNPLDRGLRFHELQRFQYDLIKVSIGSATVDAPSHLDHLLISVVHAEKDRFTSIKSLLDIHHLCLEITRLAQWNEFERRVTLEGTTMAAWSALSIVQDRYGSPVPADLLARMAPSPSRGSRFFAFTVDPYFFWNCGSLPTLAINALYTGDKERKLRTLRQCLVPQSSFLQQYFKASDPFESLTSTLIYFAILLLPALLVRKSLGPIRWPARMQYTEFAPRHQGA